MKIKNIALGRDSVESLSLIESGWKDYYHIIYESPEDGDLAYEHRFGNKYEITRFMQSLGFINEDEIHRILFSEGG